jgi:hypothetical protein
VIWDPELDAKVTEFVRGLAEFLPLKMSGQTFVDFTGGLGDTMG